MPCQVLEKAEDKENTATVDASKVKEENLEVAGGRCLRGFWLNVLCVTGEIFNEDYPLKVIFATIKAKDRIILGICCFKAKIQIFLRDLDLAVRRPLCYGGLRSPRHCLLQQRWLISICLCL